MIRLKDEVTFIENKTFTGRKLLVGIKNDNSYICIKSEYMESFYNLLRKIGVDNTLTNENFDKKEIELLEVLHNHGYLVGDKNVKKAFSEYNMLVRVFKRFKLKKNQINIKNKNIFYIVYALFWIGAMGFFLQNGEYLNEKIQIANFTFFEILLCFTVIPILIDMTHELGHYLVAECLGVEASDITIGFFVTWPTIYIRYKGLNLYSTRDKLCVISAGIAMHILNTMLGVLLKKIGIDSNILTIWCIANVGMISTNLMFLGASDGYFILTNLIGVYNLRYRGYMALKHILRGKFSVGYSNYLCAAIVLGCWIWSFFGIYITLNYYGNIFSLSYSLIIVVSSLLIILLFVRLITKIKKIGIDYHPQ